VSGRIFEIGGGHPAEWPAEDYFILSLMTAMMS